MGISVSPIIADIVLQDLEEEFLQRHDKSITYYTLIYNLCQKQT